MSEGNSVVVDGRRCQLHHFTGKVLSSKKQKETQVSSHSYGTQNNPQVQVTSTTVDHHELFLGDSSGVERGFQLVDFDFPCREGQTLTLIWVIPDSEERGPFVAARNHNTGEFHVIDPKHIQYLFKKPWWMRWGATLGVLIVGFIISPFVGLFAWIAPLVYFAMRQKNAAKTLLASDALRRLDGQVAQLKPLPA
jgi:hypothetical protein